MSNDPVLTKRPLIDNKRILIILIATLVAITLIYQLRPFLDDSQFAWISVPTYSVIPAVLIV